MIVANAKSAMAKVNDFYKKGSQKQTYSSTTERVVALPSSLLMRVRSHIHLQTVLSFLTVSRSA
jgi:hypothetical protein